MMIILTEMAQAPDRRQIIWDSAIYDENLHAATLDQGRVKPTRSVLPAKLCLVTVRPVAGASIIKSCPAMTMPTWPGAVMVPSLPAKKTRSPGLAWLAGICFPSPRSPAERRTELHPWRCVGSISIWTQLGDFRHCCKQRVDRVGGHPAPWRAGGSGRAALLTRALRAGTVPAEVTTDRTPAYPRVLDDWSRSAAHRRAACEQPGRGRSRSAQGPAPADAGPETASPSVDSRRRHALVQNLRRDHYEIATDVPSRHRLRIAFDDLAVAV
jgi:hypothetical protein